MEYYGQDFDQALEGHSGTTAELRDQLTARTASGGSD
jgi:hypothetical protein